MFKRRQPVRLDPALKRRIQQEIVTWKYEAAMRRISLPWKDIYTKVIGAHFATDVIFDGEKHINPFPDHMRPTLRQIQTICRSVGARR